jgi:CubicO group peptidase (beta-lactamase class C family)
MPELPIGGDCDPRFEPVRAAFRRNFQQLGELGAALTIYIDGHKVVDLWGGWADAARTLPWHENTLVNVFSVGKAISTLAVLDCVARGLLDLDAPIARYWPRFARADKGAITLRQVLSHRAGLPAIRTPLPPGAALDWPRMIAALEEQDPWWTPGVTHGYHVNMFGYLVGETVRAATGSSLGTLLRERILEPLDADAHLGLPESEHARVAEFAYPTNIVAPVEVASLTDEQLMRYHAYANPAELSGAGVINSRGWRLAELASTNMHASARGVGRVYAALAAGGVWDDRRIVDERLLREAVSEHSNGLDYVLERPSRFALGFQLTQPERRLGPNDDAFGHYGAGGSLGFCDPEAGVGFGYVMRTLGPRWQNPRNRALVDSLYSCL